ncbi:helix-turn-helix transcriptional regulator [Microbacterium sp. AR7-10]|uniref:helix-turn-helix domain-containing protein n=1 Tax=Microbacterium sp. AR7-10 TaxID=1891970 RepID=UPI0008FC74A0|nr:helix-turn-helix transcriptional regulator [Microbacterium sp. AR7-10]OIU88641.1 hypothetical protein BFN01_04150 [Microbacterium sp. AR7-10]
MAIATISTRVSQSIKKLLKQRGVTQEWLSTTTGIPMRTLSRRLHDVNPSPMSLDELDIIARSLNTSMAQLIEGVIAASELNAEHGRKKAAA